MKSVCAVDLEVRPSCSIDFWPGGRSFKSRRAHGLQQIGQAVAIPFDVHRTVHQQVDRHLDPGPLVGFQREEIHRRQHRQPDQGHRDQAAEWDISHQQHGRHDRHQHHGRPEIPLLHHQEKGPAKNHPGHDEAHHVMPQPGNVFVPFPQHHRQQQDRRRDGKLRGLETPPANRQRQRLAIDILPLHPLQYQQPQPGQVKRHRSPAHPLVVDQAGSKKEHRTNQHPADLVIPPVVECPLRAEMHRRVNGIDPHRDHDDHGDKEDPVQAKEFAEKRGHGVWIKSHNSLTAPLLQALAIPAWAPPPAAASCSRAAAPGTPAPPDRFPPASRGEAPGSHR